MVDVTWRAWLSRLSRKRGRAALARGNSARDAGRWNEAIAAYRRYLRHHQRAFGIWVQLGHALKESGEFDAADAAYDHALALEPQDADLHLSRGHLFKLRGNTAAAADAYAKSYHSDGNTLAAREITALANASGGEIHPLIHVGRFVGAIESVSGTVVTGWAIDPEEAASSVEIVFRSDDRVVGHVSARPPNENAVSDPRRRGMRFQAVLALARNDPSSHTVRAYFERTGEELDRSPFRTSGYSPPGTFFLERAVASTRLMITKPLRRRRSEATVILVSHAPHGFLKPHVESLLKAFRSSGISTLLVVAVDQPLHLTDNQVALVDGLIVRENSGYDFAAWAHALRIYPEIHDSSTLYLANDSIVGPVDQASFDRIMLDVKASSALMVGLTENYEGGWHIQSYFMAFKQELLGSHILIKFISDITNLYDKQDVIDGYEIPLARLIEGQGFAVSALFKAEDRALNPTLSLWKGLLDKGFPFAKASLFTRPGWHVEHEELNRFDVRPDSLGSKSTHHSALTGSVFPLLAHQPSQESSMQPTPIPAGASLKTIPPPTVNLVLLNYDNASLHFDDQIARVLDSDECWAFLVPEDVTVHPHLSTILNAYARERPDVSIFYGDEVALGEADPFTQIRLKPDFDRTMFIAQDYIGAGLIIRGSALHRLGLDHRLGPVSLTDLMLRAMGVGLTIARIAEILIRHPGKFPSVPVFMRKSAIERDPAFRDIELLPGLTAETLRIVRRSESAWMPKVSFLVTSTGAPKEGISAVSRFIDSLARTNWVTEDVHVLVGDMDATQPAWEQLGHVFSVTRVGMAGREGKPPTRAAKMNILWRAASTEYIVMMDDNLLFTDSDWLKALMTLATSEEAGVVAPLILNEDRSVRHAGLAGGLCGPYGYPWIGRSSITGTYQDWAMIHREWSAIGGPVIATRRSVMNDVGGFDELLPRDYDTVDLCLKMRCLSKRNIYTPHSPVTCVACADPHTGSPGAVELARFIYRWGHFLAADPAFPLGMKRDSLEIAPHIDADAWFWKTAPAS